MRIDQLLLTLFAGGETFLQKPTLMPEINVPGVTTVPITCLVGSSIPSTLEEVINCFNRYTVPEDTYDLPGYTAAQPTADEHCGWVTAVSTLLAVDGTCAPSLLPAVLRDTYRISLFNQADGKSFCILSEVGATVGNHYNRGWGIMVVPATRTAVLRHIHISAPHPIYDGGTPQQAAAIFVATGAKSLFISGRHRDAFRVPSCLGSTFSFSKTDAAHNIEEPFFPANAAIRDWQIKTDGCPMASCAFIQLHRQTTCADDDTFLSAGIARSGPSTTWYNTVDSPVKRIRDKLDIVFPEWTNSLPPESLTCGLTATKNTFGRLLNGIPSFSVCCPASDASATTVTGQFVHIEQNDDVLAPSNYVGIARVINLAIPPV